MDLEWLYASVLVMCRQAQREKRLEQEQGRAALQVKMCRCRAHENKLRTCLGTSVEREGERGRERGGRRERAGRDVNS